MARRRVKPDRAWFVSNNAGSFTFGSEADGLADAVLVTDFSDIDAASSLTQQRTDRYLERWLFWYRLTYFNSGLGGLTEVFTGVRLGSIEVPDGELFDDAPEVQRIRELGWADTLDAWAHVVGENVHLPFKGSLLTFDGSRLAVETTDPATANGYPTPGTTYMFDLTPRLRISEELALAVSWGPVVPIDASTTPVYGIQWYSKQLWRVASGS